MWKIQCIVMNMDMNILILVSLDAILTDVCVYSVQKQIQITLLEKIWPRQEEDMNLMKCT